MTRTQGWLVLAGFYLVLALALQSLRIESIQRQTIGVLIARVDALEERQTWPTRESVLPCLSPRGCAPSAPLQPCSPRDHNGSAVCNSGSWPSADWLSWCREHLRREHLTHGHHCVLLNDAPPSNWNDLERIGPDNVVPRNIEKREWSNLWGQSASPKP